MSDKYCSKCKKRLTTCPTCHGKGMVDDSSVFMSRKKSCPNCNGTGHLCPRHGNDY